MYVCMYIHTYIKQGTEITLNLKFEKIGLHVDTAVEITTVLGLFRNTNLNSRLKL